MITIYTNGDINIDGRSTSLRVEQRQAGTVVYCRETGGVITLPSDRYQLSGNNPFSTVPGRTAFERDLRVALA